MCFAINISVKILHNHISLYLFSNLGQSVFDYQLLRGQLQHQLRLLLVQLHHWWLLQQRDGVLHLGLQPLASLWSC